MRRSMWLHFILVFLFALFPLQAFSTVQPNAEVGKETRARVSQSYGKLPLRFEVNEGQYNDQVSYLSRGAGYSFFLTPTEAVMVLSRAKVKEQTETPEHETSVVRMQLVDSNPMPLIIPEEKQQGKTNYLKGNDPEQWRTNVTNYSKIKYRQVYPGIDLIYYGNQQKLEYDFIVSPGSDYKTIQMNFPGAEKIDIDDTGNLVLSTSTGNVVQQAPIIYQVVNGERKPIEGKYVLHKENRVGFQVAQYNTKKPLIIDPVLKYSTYLGGGGVDEGHGIATDSSGNVYVTGLTRSFSDFPIVNAAQPFFSGGSFDVFVTKINAEGTEIIYSTFLGGSLSDEGRAIAVDGSGNAYLTGLTHSTDFPTFNAIQDTHGGGGHFTNFIDAFATKLDASGAIVYSTFLGGANVDIGHAIATDDSGNAYIAGETQSFLNFPTSSGSRTYAGGTRDTFITKLDASGSIIFSTFFGGSNVDSGRGIAVDGSGNIYVTGNTTSTDFPTLNAIQGDQPGNDAFVTKLDTLGTVLYSTYVGGSSSDEGLAIAVDGSGNAYLTGRTQSTDFPTLNAIQPVFDGGSVEAFITKLDGSGGLVYSTFLGGGDSDFGFAVTADASGNAYVGGQTRSTDFPTLNAIQPNLAGSRDAFVTKLDTSGALVYSTYLGGRFVEANGIVVDGSGNVYLTGKVTQSLDFPIINALQETPGSSNDAFVVKLGEPVIAPVNARNDFDGDGDSDLLLFHDSGQLVSVLLENSVLQNFGLILQADPLLGWTVHATADFNADGKSDVFLYNTITGVYRILLINGVSVTSDIDAFVFNPGFGLEPRGVGDFNGDGVAEIILYQPSSGLTGLVYLSNLKIDRFEFATVIDEANNVTLNGTGDFNQDGKTDLMTLNTVTGETQVITMDGSTPSPPVSIFTLPPAAGFTITDTGDFDGDGKTDILAVESASGALVVLLMDGVALQSVYVPGNIPAGFELINDGAYDGDTKADFLVYSDATGELITFIQDGATVISTNSALNLGPASGWTYHKGKP